MTRIQIWVDLSDKEFHAYEREADRTGESIEHLVEKSVNTLLRELERDEEEGTDHPVIPA